VFDIAYIGNTEHYITQNWNYNYVPLGTRFKPQYADSDEPGGGFAERLPAAKCRLPRHGCQWACASTNYNPCKRKFSGDSLRAVETTRLHMVQDASGDRLEPGTAPEPFHGFVTCSSQTNCTSIDQTHVFNFSTCTELPSFEARPRPGDKVGFGGWQISGVTTFASGFSAEHHSDHDGQLRLYRRGEMPGAERRTVGADPARGVVCPARRNCRTAAEPEPILQHILCSSAFGRGDMGATSPTISPRPWVQ